MGFGTNRVVGKQLNKTSLSTSQLKGMNMLKNICDVKKQPTITEEKKEEVKVERKPNKLRSLMAMETTEINEEGRRMTEETKQANPEELPAELIKNE